MMTISRRHLLGGAAALGAAAFVRPGTAHAQAAPAHVLTAVTRTLDIGGRAATVLGLEADGRFDGLRFAVGDQFRLQMRNGLNEDTLIHWHGLTPPWRQDGVPGVSADPVPAGASADYDFALELPGTYWMHSHVGLQEQRLLAAPLIVRGADEAAEDRQEVVILLHDFSFAPPEELLARLAGPMGGTGPGGMDHAGMGHGNMNPGPAAPGGHMAGMAMDLNDIEHDAYLANDKTLDDPDIVPVEAGGRVRLRIINGAASTNFTLDLGVLDGRLVAVDGQPVVPLSGRRFPLAMAQRIDLMVDLPGGNGAYPILALREGGRQRTGVILASPSAAVARVDIDGAEDGPVVGLELERQLVAAPGLGERPVEQRLAVDLNGTMAGYAWTMDGLSPLLRLSHGSRVEIAMRNLSMMSHPMHLHGHRFQVVELDGQRLAGAVRDTVLVPPMASVTIAFDADNPGQWAFHCHHLYHMARGMMTVLRYTPVG